MRIVEGDQVKNEAASGELLSMLNAAMGEMGKWGQPLFFGSRPTRPTEQGKADSPRPTADGHRIVHRGIVDRSSLTKQ